MNEKLEKYEEVCPKCGGSGNPVYSVGDFSSTLKTSQNVNIDCKDLVWNNPVFCKPGKQSSKLYTSSSSFSSTFSCDVCGGTGKVDWIDKIMKGIKSE